MFSERVRAYEKVWVLGDDFTSRSFEKYFLRAEIPGYTVSHADVAGFYNNKFASINPNTISRLRNTLVKAIESDPLLPKFILIVCDDDIIKFFGTDVQESITKAVNYIMVEHNRTIMTHKEYLQKRSKKVGYPQFIWIQAPLHVNFANNSSRVKFNSTLETAAKKHDNVHTLQLRKGWDDEERNLYSYESRRFTSQGLVTYWNAVDKTTKYVDTIYFRKIMNKKFGHATNKFHWRKDTDYIDHDEPRWALPKPPPQR